jgi:hypothetical protein
MKMLILILIMFTQTVRADALADEITKIKVKLPEGKQLAAVEMRSVVELAPKGGIQRVAAINPMATQWGEVGLEITGADVIKGRRISRQELTIWNDNWKVGSRSEYRSTNRIGAFVLSEPSRAYTRHWATFTFGGRQLRVECRETVDLAEADKVFDALDRAHVDYRSDEVEKKTNAMRLDTPTGIGIRPDGEIYIGFPNSDSWCGDSISGKWVKGRLLIEDAHTVCA